MKVDFGNRKWNGNGSIWYKDQVMMQSELIYPVFEEFFKINKFDKMIEIGTAYAGFSLFLEDLTKKDGTKIISYDIMPIENMPFHEASPNKRIEKSKYVLESSIDFRIKNTYTQEVQQEIKDIIHSSGRCAVFCDGGNKPKELNIFANIIKSGDFIFAHDYAQSPEYYSENILNKYWRWSDCFYSDIKDSVESNNIKLYYPEYFEKVAWFCGIKE
jgi:hypothetical protein